MNANKAGAAPYLQERRWTLSGVLIAMVAAVVWIFTRPEPDEFELGWPD